MPQQREEKHKIVVIEWNMMDKKRFLPLSMLSSFTVRCFSYPFTVIKTRIQIQKHNALYSGTYDAFRKILKYEGPKGLYKGFMISSVQVGANVIYIGTYESVRHWATVYGQIENTKVKGLIGGACASMVGQTIVVPLDVISQHMMVLGQIRSIHKGVKTFINPLEIPLDAKQRFDIMMRIIRAVYKRDGIRGFYKGYVASLCTYVPNSALWWSFYHLYSDWLVWILPSWSSHLVIQVIAAPMGGVTTTIITNPLDVVRARLQIEGRGRFKSTLQHLWREERMRMFTKGLSARLIQSISASFLVILGYETIKRWSVYDEYKNVIHW